ncbi:DUF6933 domain-containing protein [Gilvimarinus sp. F26214L]|uniref:DUF6933 domain-containing protein n=1 Tax=Gilvimarinus sp. DZF01 TaxID=3461371 RepID=UPI004045C38B
MNQLRLTQKVQKAAGVRASELSDIDDNQSGLGSWTVNLFNQNRRKVLVFVNDHTLYSFILFGVRAEHYKELPKAFRRGLNQLLVTDGFSPREIEYLMSGLENITYSKTSSKKVLGNMNDLVWHYQILISENGGLEHADVGAIINQLNRMPQKNIGWKYSIEAVTNVAQHS